MSLLLLYNKIEMQSFGCIYIYYAKIINMRKKRQEGNIYLPIATKVTMQNNQISGVLPPPTGNRPLLHQDLDSMFLVHSHTNIMHFLFYALYYTV